MNGCFMLGRAERRVCPVRVVRRCGGMVRVGLLLGLAVTVLAVVIGLLGGWEFLELKLLDVGLRHFSQVKPHPDIVRLDIDDGSLQTVGRWPWPRRYLAHLVEECHQAGAKAVVLDIMMPEVQYPELVQPGLTDHSRYEPAPVYIQEAAPQIRDNDQELTGALARTGNVYLSFQGLAARELEGVAAMFPSDVEQAVTLWMAAGGKLDQEAFVALYYQLWPEGDYRNRDVHYEDLRRAMIYYNACRRLTDFGFSRAANDDASPLMSFSRVEPPLPEFIAASRGCGFVTVLSDSDGKVRRIPLLAWWKKSLYKQLAFAVAADAFAWDEGQMDLTQSGRLIQRERDTGASLLNIPLDKKGMMLISWTHWPDTAARPVAFVGQIWDSQSALRENEEKLDFIRTLRFQLESLPTDLSSLDEPTRQAAEQMRAQLTSLPDPNELQWTVEDLKRRVSELRAELRTFVQGKIVLVGSTASGAADFVISPLDIREGVRTPGIMVHANILNTLLQRAFIYQPPWYVGVCLTLVLGIMMTLLATYFRPLVSGVGVLVIILLALGVNFAIMFERWHYLVERVVSLVAIAGSFTVVTFYQQIAEWRARHRITARFKQYAAPALVDQIVKSGDNLSFSGELRELTCFFSDLAGFTSSSEKLGPTKTVLVLNIYLERMTEVLDRYSATVNKFLGDGIFAFFGAPAYLSNHAHLACLAALDSQKELVALVEQQRQLDPDFPVLKMRVGVSTGPVVVGDCGSHRRFDYTAIGDTVNLGSRLESAGKAFGVKIIISQTTYQGAGGALGVRYLGKVRVMGQTQSVGIYELLAASMDALTAESRQRVDAFEAAVQEYQAGRLEAALKAFEAYLTMAADDKAAQMYLSILRRYRADGLPDDFQGDIEMTEK